MKKILIKNLKLVKATKKDYRFIYEVVKSWLEHTDHSVTVLRIPKFSRFFKSKSNRYIIKSDGRKIGFVHILENNEIGYYLIPEFQRMGIGTWAVRELIKNNPRDRYFATINRKNKGSIKLVTKLGFRPKGIIFEKITKRQLKRKVSK